MPSETTIHFPDPISSETDVIAIGGDLSPKTLLSAYRNGIFPWFSDNEPILWWCPDPRFVIIPSQIHISKRLRRKIRMNPYTMTLDENFAGVIHECRNVQRSNQQGTWITLNMVQAFIRLHEMGYAHSVEIWDNHEMVGGLYGVSLGGCFYGESMFYKKDAASKMAFIALVGILIDMDFGLIDCQQHTHHLGSFGAVDMPRTDFITTLQRELNKDDIVGSWGIHFNDFPQSSLWNSIQAKDHF